jgi:hypothetical protein
MKRSAGLEAKDIDFLILNCSLFCPTPSLTAMIINHFKMPVNIQSYNLSGVTQSLQAKLTLSVNLVTAPHVSSAINALRHISHLSNWPWSCC